MQLASTAGNTPSASTLGAGDFTLTGTGANGVTLLGLAPTQINGNVYRYYLNGHFALGDVTVAFGAGTWTDSGGVPSGASSGTFTVSAPRAEVSAPFAGNSIDVTVANSDLAGGALYLDVTFHPTVGANIDYGSIFDAGDEFTVKADTTTIAFGAPVAIAMAPDPGTGALVATVVARNSGESDADYYTRLANAGVTRFRYTATVATTRYTPSQLTISFLPYTSGGDGWQDSNGNPGSPVSATDNTKSVDDRSIRIEGPTATIVNPSTGGAIDVSALNGRNYIDVTLAPPSGFDLDAASVTDAAAEFTLAGTGLGSITVDASQPPSILDASLGTVRYWLSGSFSAGDVTLTFLTGSWSFDPHAAPDAIVTFVGGRYVDVTFPTGPAGGSIDATTITGDEITFVVNNGHTLAVDTTRPPVRDAINASMFRYFVTGTAVTSGAGTLDTVSVHFVTGSWSYTAVTSAATTTDIGNQSGATTIDVAFPLVAGYTLDSASFADNDPEVTLGGTGLGTATIDPGVAPIVNTTTGIVRYTLSSGTSFAATGTVTVALIARSWSYIPTTAPADTPVTVGNASYVDVTLPASAGGATLDTSTVNGDELTFTVDNGHTLAIDGTHPPTVTADPFTYRYTVTGTAVDTDTVTAHFVLGKWSYVAAAPSIPTLALGDLTSTNNRTYIDVQFNATVLGGGLDTSSILTGSTPEIALGGTAVGTVQLVTGAPISLGNGRFRYLLTGDFTTGTLQVTFNGGSFSTLPRPQYTDPGNPPVVPPVVHPAVPAYTNLASTQSIGVLGPTASINTPGDGGVTGARGMNDRGYLDIAIVVPTGKTLDIASVLDLDPEFTIVGTSYVGDIQLDGTQAPVLMSTNGNTYVFRYWTKGTYTSGSLSVQFLTTSAALGFAYADGVNDFVGPVAPVNFLVGGVATPNIGYLDVLISPTAHDTLDVASIGQDDLQISGIGRGDVASLLAATPTQLTGTSIFRFYVTGTYAPGEVVVSFAAGAFTSHHVEGTTDIHIGNLATTQRFTIQQLTGDILTQPGTPTPTDTLNQRSYIDVSFTVPSYAATLDVSTVTDLDPEFTITTPSGGTIALDATQAPILLGAPINGVYTFRYFTTGTLHDADVTVNFIGGSVDLRQLERRTHPALRAARRQRSEPRHHREPRLRRGRAVRRSERVRRHDDRPHRHHAAVLHERRQRSSASRPAQELRGARPSHPARTGSI